MNDCMPSLTSQCYATAYEWSKHFTRLAYCNAWKATKMNILLTQYGRLIGTIPPNRIYGVRLQVSPVDEFVACIQCNLVHCLHASWFELSTFLCLHIYDDDTSFQDTKRQWFCVEANVRMHSCQQYSRFLIKQRAVITGRFKIFC